MANEDRDYGKGQNGGTDMTPVILNIASMLIIGALIVVGNYFLFNSFSEKIIAKVHSPEVEVDEEASEEVQRGIIIDLGDFILNLSDDNARKYLKVNVAVEVTKTEAELAPPEPEKGGGGHGGHGAPAPVDPMAEIQKQMNQFKPAIRDAVITNLTSKTSTELATTAGKELAKEQIADEINSIFAGEREVIRVSFGQFIIQ
jgi:flagellar basal body-associated protein FliL